MFRSSIRATPAIGQALEIPRVTVFRFDGMRGSAALEDSPPGRDVNRAEAAVAAGQNVFADAAVGDAAIGQGRGRDGGDEEGGEEAGFGEEHDCGAMCGLAWSREKEEGDVL